MKKFSSEYGFTLVELSIVMIIIGLLIGGILKGQELIQNARIASTVSQAKSVSVAYYTFTDTYNATPGDMPNATTALQGCDAGHYCLSGNGDYNLGPIYAVGTQQAEAWYDTPATINSENTQFWKHLALADLIGGIDPSAGVPDWGKTHLESSLGGGFHIRSSKAPASIYGSLNGITMVLRNDITGRWKCDDPGMDNCSISPATGERIDKKMDDGMATSGTVQAISSNWSNGCGIANQGINSASGYGSNNNVKSCDLMFKVDN